MKKLLFLAAGLPLLTLASWAHEVWIENVEGGLVVRFAEFGDSFEKSPGALDQLSLPTAWQPGAEGKVNAFEVTKQSDHFRLVGSAANTPAQIETGFAVMGKAGNPEKPARKPFFYARWHVLGSGPVQPALNFDLVPSEKEGEVVVYFRGKPQAGVKVKLHTPKGGEEELVSDAEGRVRFTATEQGLYMMSAAHQREAVAGFAGGKAYDAVSHNCSLAWNQK